MFVVALVLAVVAAYFFAYGIVAGQIYKSNNYGDSKGEVTDFSRGTWNLVSSTNYRTKKKNWLNDKFLVERTEQITRGY
jgi:hypothetical protein